MRWPNFDCSHLQSKINKFVYGVSIPAHTQVIRIPEYLTNPSHKHYSEEGFSPP